MAEELEKAERKAKRRGAVAEAPSLLNDDRFSKLFSDPSFQIVTAVTDENRLSQ